jgi:hypothetical protein
MRERREETIAIRPALVIVVAHAVVVALHSAAHLILDVQASPAQTVFIVAVIMIAPVLAGLLLWRKVKMTGALLLAGSMMGSLVFGVYNHFVALSPDHVSHVSQMSPVSWAVVFQVTAVLLALTEALGFGVGVTMLKRSQAR